METRHTIVVVLLLGVLSLSPAIAVSRPTAIGASTTMATSDPGRTATDATPAAVTQQAPPDPAADTIGWESGYWHNESISVDQTDGLSTAERDAFLARSMARVERIRGLEFTEGVQIEFVRRENMSVPRNDTYGLATSEQLWEALFLFGEATNASRTVRRAQRSVVLGFAAEEGSDHIVIVDPTPQRPTVGGGTLIHELAHMLQDQHFNLSRPRYQRHTLDGEFAKDGLVEGAAASLTDRYRANCRSQWRCVAAPSVGSGVQRPAPFRFYRLTYFPYSAGERYARTLIERGGWEAVTAAHEGPPVSTEQVLHPPRTDPPAAMSFTSTARNGWTRTEGRPETIGEAGIYTLFWRDSAATSPISEANLSRAGPSAGAYAYTSRPSSGWGNDRLYTYTNGAKRGYVWKTIWDTERDAREFREAYATILNETGATRQGPRTWRIENGTFADAFAVRRNGTTVTIVNGPTPPALDDIRPPTTAGRSNATTTTERSNATATTGRSSTTSTAEQPPATTGADGTTATTTTATTGPGFGGLGALVAVVLAGLALLDRSR